MTWTLRDTESPGALHCSLDAKGIRHWRDTKDIKSERLEKQLTRALSVNDIVLLVLSENSVQSDWVRWEVERGREKERDTGRDVLCPIALDDAWKTCPWQERLRQQVEKYAILDFSQWQDEEAFERQLRKLLDGLKLFDGEGG